MRMIIYLFGITVSTTTRPVPALPRAFFVDESYNGQRSPWSGSLNATVSLARAFVALPSHEITFKRRNGAVFPNRKAAAPVHGAYPTNSSAQYSRTPNGVSMVIAPSFLAVLFQSLGRLLSGQRFG